MPRPKKPRSERRGVEAVISKQALTVSGWRELLSGREIRGRQPQVRKKESQRKRKRKKNTSVRKHQEKIVTQTKLRTTDGSWDLEKINYDRDDIWGDVMSKQKDENIRIVTKNIGGLGVKPGNAKEDELKNWIGKKQIDIIGIQEVNINWKKCRGKYSLGERMKTPSWEYVRTSGSYNKHDTDTMSQWGGTLTVCKDQMTHYVAGTGGDERGLGRWSWILFQGKNKRRTRVITVYHPNKNRDPMKCCTPYQQQRQVLVAQKIEECPNEILRNDLYKSIKTWITNGDSIIVLADCNEDVRHGKLGEKLSGLGLFSPIRQKFGDIGMPATFHAGSKPIDDILITRDLKFDAVGYLPFGDGPGDHRGVYIDIDKDSMIGRSIYEIHRIKGRKLKSTDIKTVDKFNMLMKDQLEKKNALRRMEVLDKSCWSNMTSEQEVEFEKIDKAFVEAFRYANKRCKKLKKGEVAYAPEEIQLEGRKIRLWTFCIRKRCGRRISTRLITRLARKLKIVNPMKRSVEEMKEKRKEARKKYERLKPNSREVRDAWLARLANRRAGGNEFEAEKIIRNIRRVEEIRDAHKKIRSARGKLNACGTSKLIIPKEDGEGAEEVVEKEEIEEILMKTNKNKFQRAENTPFASMPLKGIVGPRSMTRDAEKMLLGTYEIDPDVEQGTAEYIQAVKMDWKIMKKGAIETEITEEDHRVYWKKAREATQSSMSGIHFGVYKSITKDDELLRFSTKLTNLPFRVGYSSERHRKDLNVTLQKKAGCYDPEKQRTIHLLEADFSEGCKIIFSRRMMQNAREQGQMREEQFARKGGRAINAALQKVLVLDQMRLMRSPGIGFASDLMNCYDRMTHAAGALSMRTLGVPAKAIECFSKTVQMMKNYIRTAYGDSESYYGGDENDLLQGGGQGNPAAPPMWCAISITILKILSMYSPGVAIISSISLAVIAFSAIMYVDDTDIFVFANQNETMGSVLERAQDLADRWTRALWASGGVLRPEKCWWYAVDFRWLGSKWRYANLDEIEGDIIVPDHMGRRCAVDKIGPTTTKRTLGVRMAVDGNMSGEKEYLLGKSIEWAAKIKKAYLKKEEATLALISTIARTWSYPLQATKFTREECEEIMSPVYKVAISKMGVCRTIPKEYRYAPKYLNGLGLPNMYTMQGIDKLKVVVNQVNSGTQLGLLMAAQLEIASLELGMGEHLLKTAYEEWEFLLTDCWFKSLWKFCWEEGIRLEGYYHRPTVSRENDEFLMEKLLTENRDIFDKEEIMVINRCRVYLQVMTMADIASGDGRYISRRTINGIKDNSRRSKWIWPRQARPVEKNGRYGGNVIRN